MTPEQIKAQTAKLKKVAKTTPLLLSAHSDARVEQALRALIKVIDRARKSADEVRSKGPA